MLNYPPSQQISERYILHEPLGKGNMGIVYRATDRLTGEVVALKRVMFDQLSFNLSSTSADNDLPLALAREFQTLASLRHPHIISVLDYGFDVDHQPYLTMTLIDDAQDICTAAADLGLRGKIDLLIQLLEALSYLHRHDVVHRDLKPNNVLVNRHQQVKVLDFGLAAELGQVDGSSGTLAYMAPETVTSKTVNAASDLYSAGMIAYELFTDHHPFAIDDFMILLDQILKDIPDVSTIPELVPASENQTPAIFGPTLREIIAQLLEKDPARRYQDAASVIYDLCLLTGQLQPVEDLQIRESFLQAARFVGRKSELKMLTDALDSALTGLGAGWLVKGESGVGKTRLLDELRSYALVKGAIVLRGQSTEGAGLPYQLLSDPLRYLALMTPLNDLEASLFKVYVPDLNQLLSRDIPDAPSIDNTQYQQRLISTIVDVFRRQTRPILLILEDLQWSIGNLELFKDLFRAAVDLPLLIVGSYRDDEQSTLAQEFPATPVLTLGRLTESEITLLSTSMLGASGANPAIVKLIKTETEGNAFFIVEVVRALAQEAGRLSEIGHQALPEHVFPGGLRQVIDRRLARVPEWAQSALHLAAVVGRRIDLALLHAADPSIDSERWVMACAEAAVLGVRDGAWWFTHDKLREKLLNDLEAGTRSALHRKIAEAIESLYQGDESYSLLLVDHWHEAHDTDQESRYAQLCGEYLDRIGQFHDAERYFNEVLRLIPADDVIRRGKLLFQLGNTCERSGDYDQALHYFVTGLALVNRDDRLQVQGLNGLSLVEVGRSNYLKGVEYAEAALTLANTLGDQEIIADSLNSLGWAARHLGEFEKATRNFELSLAIYRVLKNLPGIAKATNSLGLVALAIGDNTTAHWYFEEGLTLQQKLGDQHGIGTALNNLGMVAFNQSDYGGAHAYWQQNLSNHRNLNDTLALGYDLNNLGMAAMYLGDYQRARDYLTEGLDLCHKSNNQFLKGWIMTSLAELATTQADYETARDWYTRSLTLARQIHHVELIAASLLGLAFVDLTTRTIDTVQSLLCEVLQLVHTSQLEAMLPEVLIGFANLRLLNDQPVSGAELAGTAAAYPALQLTVKQTRLDPLLLTLETKLSAVDLAAALGRGKAADPEAVITRLLASQSA